MCVWWFITLVDAWVKPLIPPQYLPEYYLPFNVPGVGLIFGITGVMLVGALTANLFGRTLVTYSEMMLARMPIVRSVYRTLKQIFETVLSKNGGSFKRVGLIEFPRRGLYAIVFLAGEPPLEVEEKIGDGNPMITVFMPNGPNPTTGFIVFVQASEVIPLDLSVEDAAKLVVSAGLVAPDNRSACASLPSASRSRCQRKSLWFDGSPRPHQPDRVVALEEIEQQPQLLGARTFEVGIAGEREPRLVARRLQQRLVLRQPRHAKLRQAALPRAEHFAAAAKLQILLGDDEAVLGALHHVEPRLAPPPTAAAVERECRRTAPRRARPGPGAGAAGRARSARHAR